MGVETIDLRPGHTISRVIKGGWQLAGDHGAVDRDMAIRDMEKFLDAGITTFDCADIYKGVEETIGEFISRLRRNRGRNVSDKVCVHTKLVPDLERLADIRPQDIEAIIDRSLTRLKIDRLHLVQFYWWDLSIGDPLGSLEILRRCQQKGKIANLGINNWDADDIQPFIDAGFDLASAQIQYSVLDRRASGRFSDWARSQNMQLVCYGTLAGGFLTENWLGKPDPGFEFENRSLVKYRLIIEEFGNWELFQALLQALKDVGDRHGVSLSSVATRWVLDRPQVAAAIVGARYAYHLPQTLQIFEFVLADEDLARIGAIIDESAGPRGPIYGLERDRNGPHGRIMKYNLNTRPDDQILGAANG
ncbi:MAG: aldo/keto reductase [Rhizobiaceae bacterium]